MRKFVRAMITLTALCLLQSLVWAGTLTVASSGTFGSSVVIPSVSWYSPNTTWSFAFNLPTGPLTPLASDSVGFDAPFTNLTYLLGGSPVATPPSTRIRFFISSSGGMFSIYFVDSTPDGTPATGFNFADGQAFTGTVGSPTVQPNSYTVTSGAFYANNNAVQDLTGSVVNISAVTGVPGGVPEPGTFGVVAAACCLLGLARHRRKISL